MKKRVLSLVLAFVMVFSLAVPTFAAETRAVADQVRLLEGLGLIEGEGAGVTPSYLAKKMTRITAACSILKMVGKYDEAIAFIPTINFPDAKGAWTEGNNIMGYLLVNPSYGFSGDAGKFLPTKAITQEEVLKVMLTQLGFVQGIDFNWGETTAFGVSKGLVSVEGTYNTRALVQNVYSALTVPNKTTRITLAEKISVDPFKKAILVAAGLVAAENVELAAVSAEFLNLRQIRMIFNKELTGVDKDAAGLVGNYTVNGTSLMENTATISVSGKEAVITLQGTTTVTNGKTNNSVEFMDAKFDKLTSIDRDFPTMVGYTVNGPREIELEFSEAVISKGSQVYKLTTGTTNVYLSVKTDKYSNFLVIKTSADLRDGEYTLTVRSEDNNKVVDGAGYPVLAQEYKINVVKDTTAPTVEVTNVIAGEKAVTVDIKFNKSVKLNNIKARLGHVQGVNGTITNEAKTADASKEYTILFPTAVAPGTQTIYFVNGTTRATDTWGNVFEDQTLAFDVVLDTQAPTVKSIVAKDSYSLIVTFSEEVVTTVTGNGAPTRSNFIVKDAKNNKVAVSGIVTDKTKVTLTMEKAFTGGVYTVEVKNLQDKSMYKNKLVTVVMSVDTKDKVSPYVKTIAPAGDNKYTVVFSEAMDSAVADKANWKVLLKTPIAAGDTTKSVTVNSVTMAYDNKSIVIDLKVKGDTVGNKVFTAGRDQFIASVDSIKDIAGNRLTEKKGADVKDDVKVESVVNGFTATINTLGAVPMISASKIQLIDRGTIKITFKDSIIENIDDKTFVINGKSGAVSGLGMEVFDNSDTILTLSLTEKGKIPGTRADDLTSLTVKDSTAKDQYGYEIEDVKDFLGAAGVTDLAAPELMMARVGKFDDTNKDNQKQEIILTFSEDLYMSSVQDADFEVDGQTIQKIVVEGNKVTITLKNVEFNLVDQEVIVTLVGTVEDTKRNATTENTEVIATKSVGIAAETAEKGIAAAQAAVNADKVDSAHKTAYAKEIAKAQTALKLAITEAHYKDITANLALATKAYNDAVAGIALKAAQDAAVAVGGPIALAEAEAAQGTESDTIVIAYKVAIATAKAEVAAATTTKMVEAAIAKLALATQTYNAAVIAKVEAIALKAAQEAAVAVDGAITVAETVVAQGTETDAIVIAYKAAINTAKAEVTVATTKEMVGVAIAKLGLATQTYNAAVVAKTEADKVVVGAETLVTESEKLVESTVAKKAVVAYNAVISKAKENIAKAKTATEITGAVAPLAETAQATITFKAAATLRAAQDAVLAVDGALGLAKIAHDAQTGVVAVATHAKTIYGKAIEVAKKAVLDATSIAAVNAVTATGSTFAIAKTDFEKAIATVKALVTAIPAATKAQTLAIGTVITPPTTTGCTFVIKTNDGVIGTAVGENTIKVLKAGTVVYTMTHTATGLTADVSIVITLPLAP